MRKLLFALCVVAASFSVGQVARADHGAYNRSCHSHHGHSYYRGGTSFGYSPYGYGYGSAYSTSRYYTPRTQYYSSPGLSLYSVQRFPTSPAIIPAPPMYGGYGNLGYPSGLRVGPGVQLRIGF